MKNDDRAGLYITIIFHLVVIIIMLVCQISAAVKSGDSFLLDFSKQDEAEQQREEIQRQLEEAAMKEEIGERIDRMLAAAGSVPVRNVAVDRGALKDDRNTDAEELYKQAEELANELKQGYEVSEPDEDYVPASQPSRKKAEDSGASYSGPSVVSYELDGRKASRLSIPAYRCMGAGTVTVIITVDPSGNVTSAKIQDGVSSDDKCLRDFAIRAARLSRFSASASAPAKQVGNIVYLFVAQ